MQHDFLDENQIRQSVSRFHYDVAQAILETVELSVDAKLNILSAVLLLQQGLAIHDDVDTVSVRCRQLSVLAGDYNSSQYYYLLARIADGDLLMHLSRAVIQVNEAKMAILNTPSLSAERYLNLHMQIQGSLLVALAQRFLPPSGGWKQEIDSLVKAYIVQGELSTRNVPKNFTLRQGYEWLTETMERILVSSSAMSPLYNVVVDYLYPMKKSMENVTFAEGNH